MPRHMEKVLPCAMLHPRRIFTRSVLRLPHRSITGHNGHGSASDHDGDAAAPRAASRGRPPPSLSRTDAGVRHPPPPHRREASRQRGVTATPNGKSPRSRCR
jgi:hypothetical protein